MDQLTILPKQNPDELIRKAREEHQPVNTFCLFSGGKDSSALAHRCRNDYQALMFIDTGTAVPGVVEFVREFADWLDKPLVIYNAKDAFRNLVLELGGFPGPAGHGRAYSRLKERQIRKLVRDFKVACHPNSCVMLLTGKRRAESARRAKTTLGIDKRGGQLYVNPLIDWTSADLYRYRDEHQIPVSPVAALLGMSGECGCGAFATDKEWEMRKGLFPEWAEPIEALQVEAEAKNGPESACRWGGYDAAGNRIQAQRSEDDDPALCASCVWQQIQMEAA